MKYTGRQLKLSSEDIVLSVDHNRIMRQRLTLFARMTHLPSPKVIALRRNTAFGFSCTVGKISLKLYAL